MIGQCDDLNMRRNRPDFLLGLPGGNDVDFFKFGAQKREFVFYENLALAIGKLRGKKHQNFHRVNVWKIRGYGNANRSASSAATAGLWQPEQNLCVLKPSTGEQVCAAESG